VRTLAEIKTTPLAKILKKTPDGFGNALLRSKPEYRSGSVCPINTVYRVLMVKIVK
jgi:hypothetical protein